ncbi:MAG: hypothetical protein ASARMPRED_006619 [Alectoria sarmentosa]|nr:MAG: hypothetical protein ASARMPRED_006619 [Alectoria sarmentosa]
MYSAESTVLVVVSSVLLPLASVFVALRFRVRKSMKAGIRLDDYIILAALILQYAGVAINIFGAVAGGEGDLVANLVKHPSEMANYAKVPFVSSIILCILGDNVFLKLQYIVPMVFAATVALVKVSTLILYKRIFVTKEFHLACLMMMVLTAGWFLTCILVGSSSGFAQTHLTKIIKQGEVFSYKTVSQGPKNPNGPFSIHYAAFMLSMGAINMVLDVVVVCMPLSVIQALQISSVRKAQVSGIFLLGLFCIIAAAVRVYYLQIVNKFDNEVNGKATTTDTSQLDTLFHTTVIGIIWFLVEAHTSIIAACLPTLAPLFRKGHPTAFKFRSISP